MTSDERLAFYLKSGFRLAPKDKVWFKLWAQRLIERLDNPSYSFGLFLTSDERHAIRAGLCEIYGINSSGETLFLEIQKAMLDSGFWVTTDPVLIKMLDMPEPSLNWIEIK